MPRPLGQAASLQPGVQLSGGFSTSVASGTLHLNLAAMVAACLVLLPYISKQESYNIGFASKVLLGGWLL